jgi:hypothetical protein
VRPFLATADWTRFVQITVLRGELNILLQMPVRYTALYRFLHGRTTRITPLCSERIRSMTSGQGSGTFSPMPSRKLAGLL